MGLSVLFQPLQGLLTYFQNERHNLSQERNQQKDQVLADLNAALIATTQYLSRGVTDPSVEGDLSQRWARAAQSCRHFDKDLATDLQMKSFYWGDRASVKESEVIQLQQIQQAIVQLIRID